MLVAVLAYSVTPIAFKFGQAETSPFLFAGIIHFTASLPMLLMAVLLKGDIPVVKPTIEGIRRHPWMFIVPVLGGFTFVLLAAALAFVDVSLAAVLHETWPLFLLLVMLRLDHGVQRYNRVSLGTVLLFIQAFAAISLVILSHNDTPTVLPSGVPGLVDSGVVVGVFLVLCAAFLGAAFGGCTLRLGTIISAQNTTVQTKDRGDIVYSISVVIFCRFLIAPMLCGIGLLFSETLTMHQFLSASAFGFVVTSLASIGFRMANLKTKDLGVNALSYASPLLTLLWLWMLSKLEVPHTDYLIIGAMGIVSANLLINAAPTMRGGYKALVVSTWVIGASMYLNEWHVAMSALSAPLASIVQITGAVTIFIIFGIVRSVKSGVRHYTLPMAVSWCMRRSRIVFSNDTTSSDGDKGDVGVLEITPARPGTRRLALVSSILIMAVFAWLFASDTSTIKVADHLIQTSPPDIAVTSSLNTSPHGEPN